jgi:hypothetical protein
VDHAPSPKSFIDANAFESPKALADHLKRVAANADAYDEFFEWRRQPVSSYGKVLAKEFIERLLLLKGLPDNDNYVAGTEPETKKHLQCTMCDALERERKAPEHPPQKIPPWKCRAKWT